MSTWGRIQGRTDRSGRGRIGGIPTKEIPEALLRIAESQEGLLSWAQCRTAGTDQRQIHRLIGSGRWSAVLRGVYDTDPTPPDRRRRDDYLDHVRRRDAWTAILAYTDGIGVGQVALTMWHVQGLPRDIVREISRERRRKAPGRGGVVVRQYRGFETFRLIRGSGPGCLVAGAPDAIVQALPGLPMPHAVAVLSNALHQQIVPAFELDRIRTALAGRRGGVRALQAVDLASGADESPAESFARLSLIEHAVPPDRVQVTFRLGGRVIARCDFAWYLPGDRWFVVEIDGLGPHSKAEALVRDAPRQNAVLGTGKVLMLRFAPVQNERPGGIGREVAERLRALGWHPATGVPQGDIHL
ncbi:type IV toxin-antitoxin system AbiEi family antitoxin domain-containing protein [Myceligenerans crystallogenes]|uniref:type IV toxin-antitoxin system AbiEi family antitoxin domain-containing protein n=1 Tax=Myceligenerans crystallogenes TaxID=316335 RepID=UPI0031CF8834